MVSIADFVDVALYTVKRIEINDKVNFKTFKKDKGLFNVSENGFNREVFLNLHEKDLKRTLKYLQKKEFPKSNKLWYKIIRTKK